MNPATVLWVLKLVADGAPVVVKMVEDLRAGREPTEADWKEIEALGAYSSEEAKKR